jgi:hypothetical protein
MEQPATFAKDEWNSSEHRGRRSRGKMAWSPDEYRGTYMYLQILANTARWRTLPNVYKLRSATANRLFGWFKPIALVHLKPTTFHWNANLCNHITTDRNCQHGLIVDKSHCYAESITRINMVTHLFSNGSSGFELLSHHSTSPAIQAWTFSIWSSDIYCLWVGTSVLAVL